MKQTLLVVGDAQSEALAFVFKNLDAIRSRYIIEYADVRTDNAGASRDAAQFSVIVEQRRVNAAPDSARRLRGRLVTFPTLRFDLLWPLLKPNQNVQETNRGRVFPWTDSFFQSCKEQNIPRDQALQLYESGTWSPSWPNLDSAFKRETEKLLAADVACDVKIGSYILKHFRRQRLFLAPNIPTNALIAELAFRTLHACLGRDDVLQRDSIRQVLSSAGEGDLMAAAAVPIHPAVARHFSLEWYEPTRNSIDASFGTYYRDLLDYTYA